MRRIAAVLIILVLVFAGSAFAEEINEKEIAAKQTPPAPTLDPAKRAAVNAILKHPFVKDARASIKVVSLTTGQTIFAQNSDQLLVPASTNKILSGSAALETLGPLYRFTTGVYYDGKILPDGTLTGNLYIKGGGDPSLNLEQTWLLAHQIASYGVKVIEGKLIGDAGFLDDTRHYEQWGEICSRAYHAPLGALSVNFNTLGAFVAPGPKIGSKGRVVLNPNTDQFTLVNGLTTSADGITRVAITINNGICTVSGQIPFGCKGTTYYRSIKHPLPFALSAFKNFLQQEGVIIAKGTAAGAVPANARLLFEHQSKPLALIIRDLMRSSNNFTAEQIARTMGAEKYGAPGSQEKASDAIIAWLKETELYQPGVVAEDASGLSHTNQISADVLVGILQYMWSRPETGPEFVDALAIGGKDGTLKHRFKRTPLQGRIRAKSGTLWGVITLAGYGYDANNKPYAFAIMFNNFSPKASGRQIQYIAERTLNTLLR